MNFYKLACNRVDQASLIAVRRGVEQSQGLGATAPATEFSGFLNQCFPGGKHRLLNYFYDNNIKKALNQSVDVLIVCQIFVVIRISI